MASLSCDPPAVDIFSNETLKLQARNVPLSILIVMAKGVGSFSITEE
jgi:hypothetical protein